MPRLSPLVLAAALAALPATLHAQSALERMESMSEAMTEMTYVGLVAQVPALEGNLPSPEWDDEMRAAGQCVLDGVEEVVGRDGVTEMLDNMEAAMADATPEALLSGDFNPAVPEGITDAEMQAISNGCRMVEIMMIRMMESGAMSIMMESSQ